MKAIILTIFLTNLYIFTISHPVEGTLRKRGNLAETSKLLKVCTFNYATVLYRAAPSLLPSVHHRYDIEASKYIFTAICKKRYSAGALTIVNLNSEILKTNLWKHIDFGHTINRLALEV